MALEIVYFGNDWSGENKTSSHHIAERLAKEHRVLYVECPGLRMPRGSKRDLKKLFDKLRKCLGGPRQVGDRLWVHTLFQIPLHRFALVRRVNRSLILLSLRRVMKRLGMRQPLLWFLLPHLSLVPGRVPASAVVYYCIDNYAALPDVDRGAVLAMDQELTAKADLVFVASLPLYQKKQGLAARLLLSPHGVDFQHFNQAAQHPLPRPADIAGLAGPIVGFWGLIENWIDLELVAHLARRHPDWQFVMIGHLAARVNPCAGLANVHFLGARKFAQLPAYACAFDVAILPYLLNEQVYNCNPIKLREYLATGKPVVSVRYPEVEKYRDVVAIADDAAQFEQHISFYLEHDSAELAAGRVARVRGESWDSRVQEILAALQSELSLGKNV